MTALRNVERCFLRDEEKFSDEDISGMLEAVKYRIDALDQANKLAMVMSVNNQFFDAFSYVVSTTPQSHDWLGRLCSSSIDEEGGFPPCDEEIHKFLHTRPTTAQLQEMSPKKDVTGRYESPVERQENIWAHALMIGPLTATFQEYKESITKAKKTGALPVLATFEDLAKFFHTKALPVKGRKVPSRPKKPSSKRGVMPFHSVDLQYYFTQYLKSLFPSPCSSSQDVRSNPSRRTKGQEGFRRYRYPSVGRLSSRLQWRRKEREEILQIPYDSVQETRVRVTGGQSGKKQKPNSSAT